MKLIGALLVILTGFLSGYQKIQCEYNHIAALRAFCLSLDAIEGELELNTKALPQLFKELSNSAQSPAKEFYYELYKRMKELGKKRFAELWQESSARFFTILSQDEQSEWLRLGLVLGRYTTQEQVAAVHRCRTVLETSLADLQHRLPQESRLYLGLGAAVSTLLVIVLY